MIFLHLISMTLHWGATHPTNLLSCKLQKDLPTCPYSLCVHYYAQKRQTRNHNFFLFSFFSVTTTTIGSTRLLTDKGQRRRRRKKRFLFFNDHVAQEKQKIQQSIWIVLLMSTQLPTPVLGKCDMWAFLLVHSISLSYDVDARTAVATINWQSNILIHTTQPGQSNQTIAHLFL